MSYHIKRINFDALISGKQTPAEAAFGSSEQLVDILQRAEAKAKESGKSYRELFNEGALFTTDKEDQL